MAFTKKILSFYQKIVGSKNFNSISTSSWKGLSLNYSFILVFFPCVSLFTTNQLFCLNIVHCQSFAFVYSMSFFKSRITSIEVTNRKEGNLVMKMKRRQKYIKREHALRFHSRCVSNLEDCQETQDEFIFFILLNISHLDTKIRCNSLILICVCVCFDADVDISSLSSNKLAHFHFFVHL